MSSTKRPLSTQSRHLISLVTLSVSSPYRRSSSDCFFLGPASLSSTSCRTLMCCLSHLFNDIGYSEKPKRGYMSMSKPGVIVIGAGPGG